MLPSHLLLTRTRRDRIYPVYAAVGEETLALARMLVQTYAAHVGAQKGALSDAVTEFEELGYDHRFIRGLAVLLDRRCHLAMRPGADPVRVRRRVFTLAHQGALPTTPTARTAVLARAAATLGITVDALESTFYADLDDELVLNAFHPVDPASLLRQYNLSLTQTLLFHATELRFTAAGNWQHLFRTIKWLGLIYAVERGDTGYMVTVDGPVSLFKLIHRYGARLARLLPTLTRSDRWRLTATILRRTGERRLRTLQLNSATHGPCLPVPDATPEPRYDSQVEADFARRFDALRTGWTLRREPEPLPVGRQVLIPDFRFERSGVAVYLEIVGFWTPRYLREKLKKFAQLRGVDMLVAADKQLACRGLEQLGATFPVIYYTRRVPLKPVLTHLKAREAQLVNDQIQQLHTTGIHPRHPAVDVRDLAAQLGVLADAVRATLRSQPVAGYTRLGDLLIADTKLDELAALLERRRRAGPLSLSDAATIVEAAGGRRPTTVLAHLGYQVQWRGIDPRSARVVKAADDASPR